MQGGLESTAPRAFLSTRSPAGGFAGTSRRERRATGRCHEQGADRQSRDLRTGDPMSPAADHGHEDQHHLAGSPPARRLLVSGNWKMHLTHLQAITLVQDLAGRLAPRNHEVEVTIHPAFTSLRSLQVFLEGNDIPLVLGAQNVASEHEGAFTGEVSTSTLAALDVCYVIVGHSERRRLFGETDEIVNEKIHAVHEARMTPICCVGDSLEDHERGATDDVVVGQVTAALRGVGSDAVAGMVIAYEPLWAIGAGRSAAPGDAEAV